MAIYNQEHGDYGVYRKYPFTDASTLKTVSGAVISPGLITDAVLYASSAATGDVVAWLALVDLGNRSARVRTATGRTLSGRIAGTRAELQDDATLLYAGVLLFDEAALAAAGRARYEFGASGAIFSASCVFALTVPGVATINQLYGHVTLEGRDGVQVFTGEVDGRPALRVDAVGRPVTRDDCPDTSKAIRCIRFAQEAGAPLAVSTTGRGDVIINGVSSFTGETLCTSPRSPAAVNILAGAVTGGAYSPEAWQASQAVKDAMREAGYFWAIAPLWAPTSGPQSEDGLILTWISGGPLFVYGKVTFRGNYSAYGYTGNPDNWYAAPYVAIRNFTIVVGKSSYMPVRYSAFGLTNTTHTIDPSESNPDFENTYYISPDIPAEGGAIGTGTAVVIDPNAATYLSFAALLPIREVAAWTPAGEQETVVCARRGAINIYGPHYEDGSNPIKSDRDNGMIYLRGEPA